MTNRRPIAAVLTITVLAIVAMAACRRVNDTLYARYADIPPEGWRPQQVVCFLPPEDDSLFTGERGRLEVMVRYRDSRPLPPLLLIAIAEDSEGELLDDTLSIPLFAPDGRGLTAPRHGICETSRTIADDIVIRKGLSVRLVPLSPPQSTAGLLNIGIKLSANESHSAPSRQ